jgi:hypothetical protein
MYKNILYWRAHVCVCVCACVCGGWGVHNRPRSRNPIFQREVCAKRYCATRRGHSPSTLWWTWDHCISWMLRSLNQWKQQFPKLVLNGCFLTFFVLDNTYAKCRKSCSFTKTAVSESSRHLLPFYLNYLDTTRLEEFSLNTEFSKKFMSTFTTLSRFGKRSGIYLT